MCCLVLLLVAPMGESQNLQQEGLVKVHQNSTAEEVNLLKNGGLEEWYNEFWIQNYMIDWHNYNNDNVKKEQTIVCEGKFSAKMQSQETGSTTRIDQRVAVCPGHKIRIRFSYYVEQWKTKGARTYCYFRTEPAEAYDISADELKAFYGQEQYYIIRGGGYGKTYLPHNLNVWQTFDETVEVPPTANYFVFGVNSYYGTTIYVDDCWVIDVTETTPKGDVTGDGKVDVSDYIGVANHILGSTPTGFNEKAADVNDDGKVDVSDYIGIANIILTGSVYGNGN